MSKTQSERRGGARRSVAFRASVSDRAGGDRIPCTVRDASLNGCRIVCARLADLSDDIHLSLARLRHPIDARIVWRQGRLAGVEFLWRDPDRAVSSDATGPMPSR